MHLAPSLTRGTRANRAIRHAAAVTAAFSPAPMAPVPRRSWGGSLPCALVLFLSLTGLALLPVMSATAWAVTLQEAFEAAGPANGYGKWVELQTGVVYEGGLQIGPSLSPLEYELVGPPGVDTRIVGNGAILDLQGGQLLISDCNFRLDIDDCIILNGNIRYRGITSDVLDVNPTGSVRYCTFWRVHDYGIRLQGAGAGITLERNLVVTAFDTGWDWVYTTGMANSWLPTGACISFSGQDGLFGTPLVRENWTFQEGDANLDPLRHYSRLCDWG